jgi:hypothetical protein
MSKYLIKPYGSLYKNPSSIYDLKRELLLYDKVGVLSLHYLLKKLYEKRTNPLVQYAINEIEYLIQQDLFIEITSLFKEGESAMEADDRKLADFTMDLLKKEHEATDARKKEELFWMHDELNTRLFCNLANANNESVYTVPALKNYASFELSKTTKEKAYNIIQKLIPLPSDNTSWEKILDFKNDNESQLKLLKLRNWINELSPNVREDELEDKIKYLINDYAESLKRHNIDSRLSMIKTVITTIPAVITELIRFKFDKTIGAFFSIAEQQVNFQKYKETASLNGNELAYIAHVNSNIRKK